MEITNGIKETKTITLNLVDNNKLYTPEETASILRCKKNTLYTWKYQKRINSVKAGGKFLFLGRDIKSFVGVSPINETIENVEKTCYDKGTIFIKKAV